MSVKFRRLADKALVRLFHRHVASARGPGRLGHNVSELGAPVTDSPNDDAYDCTDQWKDNQPCPQTLFGVHVTSLDGIDD